MANERIIPFMRQRKLAAVFSMLLILGSIASLAFQQLNFGLDFTGGTLIEVGYEQPANVENIRQRLETANYAGVVVQHFGSETEVLVRLQEGFSDELGVEVLKLLRDGGDQVDLRRIEFVGPKVGAELRDQGGLGMLFALMVVMLYVAVRFQFKFSVGAVTALAHDVTIVLGMFSLLGWTFDLTVLAALLAVIGYSLNDTIVVSDRIRENFRGLRKRTSEEVIDISLTQTLGRTMITSATTMVVLIALLAVGGELIRGFAVALLAGVIVGTYSSIFVASNVLLSMNITQQDLLPPEPEEKEGEEGEFLEEMP